MIGSGSIRCAAALGLWKVLERSGIKLDLELAYRRRMRSFNAVQSHLNAIYINNILRARYAFYNLAHHAEIIPVLPTFERRIGNFDGAQLPYIIELGEKEGEAHVPYLKRLLARAGDAL